MGEGGEGAKGLVELNAAAMAFGRVARAVRQTILLQTRLTEALDAKQKAAAATAERRAAVTARMAGVVRRAIEAEHGDAEHVERLVAEAAERLEEESFGEALERPVQEIIADICEAIGLHPDWSGLAREVADVEAFARRAAQDAADDDDEGPFEVYWLGDDGRPVRAGGPDSS